jgi:hypothetical protein
VTIFIALVTFLLMPRSVATSRYFTQAGKDCAKFRLEVELDANSKLFWTAILKPFRDWQTWLFGFMALCYGVGIASVANFLPASPLDMLQDLQNTDTSRQS